TMQGGNSGQCGGATPDNSGDALLLSLRRMNRIRSVDAGAMQLMGDAGVILTHAHEAAEAAGLRFPLTLGGKGSATLGGLVSTNAGGTQVLRHGTMRALILGLEVVLADGSLLDMMMPLAKDNQGFDPKQMFIGAEGTLGVVTGVTLRLVPNIASRCVGWFSARSPHDALRALRHIEPTLGKSLEGFEIIPQEALDNVLKHVPGTRAPIATAGPWHVLVELVAAGEEADPAPRVEAALAELLEAGVATDAIAAAYPGATSLAFGHLGDGNVHFHFRPPNGTDANAWIAEHGKGASHIVYAAAVAMGGSISAEHGIGRIKRDVLTELGDPVRLSILNAAKSALDPSGLFNPGVLIP
ncbi:MAG: FAD-binding oxidoreductase, partial [Sphingopyxis sp.]